MKARTKLAAAAVLSMVSVAGLAATNIEVVGTPEFSRGCGEGANIKLGDNNTIELVLPDFEAVTTQDLLRVRKNCVITAKIKAPVGYKLAPASLRYEGAAKISQGGSGNITARYYLTGTESLAGYQTFHANFDDLFTVATVRRAMDFTRCGAEAEFNFMGDIVARSHADMASEVVVHRGNADADVPEDMPVIQCGVHVVPCN